MKLLNQIIITMEDKKPVVTTGHKTFHFDWPKDVDKNLKHEVDSILKYNELLDGHAIKDQIRQLLSKCNHGDDSWTQKTVKRMNHINLVLTCHKD